MKLYEPVNITFNLQRIQGKTDSITATHFLWTTRSEEAEKTLIAIYLDCFFVFKEQEPTSLPYETIVLSTLSIKNITPIYKKKYAHIQDYPFAFKIPIKGKNGLVLFKDQETRDSWAQLLKDQIQKATAQKKMLPSSFDATFISKTIQAIPMNNEVLVTEKIPRDREKEKKWLKAMSQIHARRGLNLRSFEVAKTIFRYRISEHGTYIKWFTTPKVVDEKESDPEKSLEAQLKFAEESVFADWKKQLEDFDEVEKVSKLLTIDDESKKTWLKVTSDNMSRIDDMLKYQLEVHKIKMDDLETLKKKKKNKQKNKIK